VMICGALRGQATALGRHGPRDRLSAGDGVPG
jgi:hypothetical protein